MGARTRQSAHIPASHAPIEVEATPTPPPLKKTAPPGFGKGDCAAVKTSIDAAARANSSDDDDDDDASEYSYFGYLPNPDPKDLSPRNVCRDFISLFVGSRKSQVEYPKARKIKIFYEALTVEKKDILGCKPPKPVRERFDIWSRDVKKRGKWQLNGIAESVYIIARHVHNHQEKLREKGCHASSTNSKIIALELMYSHFITEINLAKANRQSQNKAAAAKNLLQQKPNSTKPLPPNFRYNASKVCIYVLCAVTDYSHSLILLYLMNTTSRLLIFLVPCANTMAL